MYTVFKVYVRSTTGPKGPLTAREIKERVTAEYLQVSISVIGGGITKNFHRNKKKEVLEQGH